MLATLRKLLLATDRLFGDVRPARVTPPPRGRQSVDGRTAAMRVLREYVCSLVFYLPDAKSQDTGPLVGPVTAFQIRPDNFYFETPDSIKGRRYPSVQVVTQGDIQIEAMGFTPQILEETRDQFGPGTALERHHVHVENFGIEAWASTAPELRSIVAGLESAFNPVEGRAGLLFRMPQYYDVTARFLLTGRTNYDDTDAALGRRHELLKVAMDFCVVSLVPVVPLVPRVTIDTCTGLEALPGAEYTVPPDAVDARRHHRPLS